MRNILIYKTITSKSDLTDDIKSKKGRHSPELNHFQKFKRKKTKCEIQNKKKILNSIHRWFKFADIKKLQINPRLDQNVLAL